MRSLHRILWLGAIAVAVIGAASAVAQPAHAADKMTCWKNKTLKINLRNHENVKVTNHTCILRREVVSGRDVGYRYKAWVTTDWKRSKVCAVGTCPERLDRYEVHARLEFNDTQLDESRCPIADQLNERLHARYECATLPTTPRRFQRGYTSDGYVIYDAAGDGKGARRVELHGSKKV
jgi:hypothetical protein